MSPRDCSVRSINRHGFHTLRYRDWGDPDSDRTVLCFHGLTRNSHDFDPLAKSMSRDHRVVCPDIVGRGRSDWLARDSGYHLVQYNFDAALLAARVGAPHYGWIGTSLGGLMGISLAGMENSPISRLVINDIAPEIPLPALRRVSRYIRNKTFEDLESAEAHLRETLAPFGPMTDRDWKRMVQTSTYRDQDGIRMAFDPGIFSNFQNYWLMSHFNLWRYWERITCPVLILRGTESDFLPSHLLDKMIDRLPHADVIEFENVGHTPTLNAAEQIEPVLAWWRGAAGYKTTSP
ncbi:alpha/beta fold hydrolase [Sedimentitalea sp. HM32M-2]|uniref:alpha/beta fold hydrolase n=1 Tax=Sedimentitalea sp. HM32M-2 TaxID=3351566 RepID=UPI003631ECA7